MIAGGEELKASFFCTKDKPKVYAGTALEIIFTEATNTQARVKMRFPKSVADCIDCARHFAPARFRKFPNPAPKRF